MMYGNSNQETASMENITMNERLKEMKSQCRRYARQLWREHPEISIDEMIEHDEIKKITSQEYKINLATLQDWILPDITPHEELPMFSGLTMWTIEEAVALWLDINPFIFVQAVKNHRPNFWSAAFIPSYREMLSLLLDKAQRAALSGHLTTKEFDNQLLVSPRDFYHWAMANTEGPFGSRPKDFFADLQADWDDDGKDRKETRVEGKIREINRILDAIKAADPEFNPASMPGRKQDFHELCRQLNKPMFSIALDTFNDYLAGICKFKPGARETNYYARLTLQLGG